MSKKVNCVMLIDDNEHDNYFHERIIRMAHAAEQIVCMESATDALRYLREKQQPHPDLIFLDINMPGMNGWEFLEEYDKLSRELQSKVVVIMLTTSENPDDRVRAQKTQALTDYKTKPLTPLMLTEILDTYF
jgi:CheY-like chemotaxis protein